MQKQKQKFSGRGHKSAEEEEERLSEVFFLDFFYIHCEYY